MDSTRAIRFGASALVLALFIGGLIWVKFDAKESRLEAEQRRLLSDQRIAWAQEDAQRAIAAEQEVAQRAKARAEKLVAALGGPVEAAFKNPELGIGQMLNQVALACAPPNSRVSVTVDRFTEFIVSVTLPGRLTSTQLADIAQRLLQKGVPYVQSVRFIQNDLVLAELDWPAIESVTDWSRVSLEEVARLISPANAMEQPSPTFASANEGGASNPAPEDLSPDQRKIEAANNAFKENYRTHFSALKNLVASLDQASRLDTLWTRERLESRIASLDQLATALSAERQFFFNQPAEMNRLLKAQALEPLAITIITRNMKDLAQSESAVYAGVFDALAAYGEQIQAFLKGMGNHWGEWQADSSTKAVLFTSAAAREAYRSGSAQLAQSGESDQKAFQSWASYQPPK
jgi:hypothetical protein